MDELSSKKLLAFFRKYATRNYKKREIILRPDNTAAHVFYLKSGYARQFVVTSAGMQFTTLLYKQGDCFPLLWLYSHDQVTNRYFEAMTKVELLSAPKEAFSAFIKSEPQIYFELTKKLVSRIDLAMERIEYLTFGHAYTKVASMLLALSARFGEHKGKNLIIKIPLTHRDVGELIGISRETTSLEIEKLRKKGFISFSGHQIVVKNLAGLKKESTFETAV